MIRRIAEAVAIRLPWYRPSEVKARMTHTESVRRRAIVARIRAERAVASYRAGTDAVDAERGR